MKNKLIAIVISICLAGGTGATVYKANVDKNAQTSTEITASETETITNTNQDSNEVNDNIDDGSVNESTTEEAGNDVANADKPQENTGATNINTNSNSTENNGQALQQRNNSERKGHHSTNKVPVNNKVPVSNNSTSTSQDTNASDKFMAQVEQAIYQKVNEERAKNGLSALSYNTTKQKYARIKSQDMGDNNYFSHEDKNGNLITVKMKQDGVSYRAWAENIAYIGGVNDANALATQFMTNWMNSAGHRANILSGNYSDIGVGVYKIGNKVYATQEFYN